MNDDEHGMTLLMMNILMWNGTNTSTSIITARINYLTEFLTQLTTFVWIGAVDRGS
jgi:hypothetical protein